MKLKILIYEFINSKPIEEFIIDSNEKRFLNIHSNFKYIFFEFIE